MIRSPGRAPCAARAPLYPRIAVIHVKCPQIVTGYLVYGPSLGGDGIGEFGGTSFVAPQLNAAASVIDSALGHRVGFWNPAMYAAAVGAHSPFTQLNQASTSNDNIYYTGNPGELYNEGVGLGIPNLAELAGDFRF